MKILWITNIMLPPVCEALGMPVPAVGGWMYSSLKRLLKASDHRFAVATVYYGKELIMREIEGVTYYLLPVKKGCESKYNRHLEAYWKEIDSSFGPDVTHIHGTELTHGLAYIRACGADGTVVSIQGLASCVSRYYDAGIDSCDLRRLPTLRDFLKNDGILKRKEMFAKRGEYETELLRSVSHIIGRTDWDKAHSMALNPAANYHYCGETLRDSFYRNKWTYSCCEPHSIFVSQAGYPIKGLHMLLKAMPLVLEKYPDAKVYVGGEDTVNIPKWRLTGYGAYLRRLIDRHAIASSVFFTGILDEAAMCGRYLESNIFVCCSSLENSPNSLGEAQLLGVPFVASFVGGVPEIAEWNRDVLYRFEEYEMLAQKIIQVFDARENVVPAPFDRGRYDGDINRRLLLEIYDKVALFNA